MRLRADGNSQPPIGKAGRAVGLHYVTEICEAARGSVDRAHFPSPPGANCAARMNV